MKSQIVSGLFLLLLIAGCDSGSEKASVQSNSKSADASVVATADPVAADLPFIQSDFTTDYIMGKFDPGDHPDFTAIHSEHTSKETAYLRKDTYEAFRRMYEAAQQDGVRLVILSAARNFPVQQSIWEAKWTGQRLVEGGENLAETTADPTERALKILRYSSMPGTSRHHWGTDIDLNSLNNEFFESGEGKEIYDWLITHAAEYGFCQPYTEKGPARPHGYNEERWHWSYLPVAKKLTDLAGARLKNDMISGFKGAEVAGEIDVVSKYVLGINPDCL